MPDKIHADSVTPSHPVTHENFKRKHYAEEKTQVDDYYIDTIDTDNAEQVTSSEEKAPKTIARTVEEQLDQLIEQCDRALQANDEAAADKAVWLARNIVVLMLSKEAKFNHEDLEKIARRVEIAVQKIRQYHTDTTTIVLKCVGAVAHIAAGFCALTPAVAGVVGISQTSLNVIKKAVPALGSLGQATTGVEGIAKAKTDALMTGAEHERSVANELKQLKNDANSSTRSTREQQSRHNADAEREKHDMMMKVLTATQA